VRYKCGYYVYEDDAYKFMRVKI